MHVWSSVGDDVLLRHKISPQMWRWKCFLSFCFVVSQFMMVVDTGGESISGVCPFLPSPSQLVKGTQANGEVDVSIWQW